ncbi:nucleoid-associated protein YgaU [Nocardioides sp. BE266]|uniref:LysM peptidoglycan-binding domain-containing protein n=1 Tax=Nocardioides sp. BE266 TaxID=2817725 RepID=UPI002859D71F|nr:LysM peptidoglycan-binding domain-containing protein [Nocardioides sp. BE266]MDR7254959.1 nucleoid-associated protein YgaU [Nocardioides sp. BE266]
MLGFFKWLGALAALLVLLVGFPALLIAAVGNPWPDGGLSELALMSNSALMGLVVSLGWFVWAQLLLCTLWEIPPALRRETEGASRMPIAFGGQQRFMRMLVHTVLAIGVTSTTLLGSHAATAQAAAAPPLQPVTQVAHQTPVATETPAAETPVKANPNTHRAEAELPRIVIDKGDTMWGLAETHLGDGFRWQEIAGLNKGRVMADGRVFNNPRNIEVGWELLLPADATNVPGNSPETEHTVAPTETLSGIALETTGDADNWPALYEANQDVIGSDPNVILPGQELVLPGTGGTAGTGAEDRPAQPDDSYDAPGEGEQPTVPGARGGNDAAEEGTQDQDQVPEEPATPLAPEQEAPAEEPPATSTQQPTEAATGDVAAVDEDDGISALDALLASAVCLSAGALGLLLRNRRRQWRWRKTGRMIASTPDELVEVEASIIEHGTEAQKDAEFLDRALRYVSASCKVADTPLPALEAAVLGDEDLTLLFAEPAQTEVPEGWTATEDARAWMLPRWTILEEELENQPPPYPALVSVGLDEGGHTWYLDLETLGLCGIGGEPQQVADLARFMVAELAVNEWAEGCEVLLADDFAAETVRLNPARLRQVPRDDALARAAVLTGEMGEVEQNLDADVLTRRRDGLLLDTTSPVVVVVSSRPTDEFVSDIEARDRSRVVVLHGDEESPSVELSGDGMAFLPKWRISVKAFSLQAEDATPMADLIKSSRNLNDEPIPDMTSDDGPLGKYARADGSLREEYTAPRRTEGNDPSSQLPEADAVYLATAATTVEDLAAIAPSIPEEVRKEIADLDPTLDQDLADWYDETSPRPKVHLLGAVEVTTLAGGDRAAIHTLAGTVSFIAYLAWLDKGVTGERAASDCGWATVKTVQNRAKDARFLLGKRPDGTNWLPDAGLSAGAVRGTTPTYELVKGLGGVLTSADLFIRLRNRAVRRGDAGGFEEDLVKALALVTGAPFEGATERLFKWLLKTGRPDDILAGAIHDAAHTLATRAVTDGRTDLVRLACEAARRANPNADISWLDQAAATEAESGRAAAGELVREQVLDRFDEDLPDRSESIVEQREWGAAG